MGCPGQNAPSFNFRIGIATKRISLGNLAEAFATPFTHAPFFISCSQSKRFVAGAGAAERLIPSQINAISQERQTSDADVTRLRVPSVIL